jgi:hypothetical protein
MAIGCLGVDRRVERFFSHTPDECFMQQYTSGQCPICHPHPARRHLLVKDSKIFVPLLDTVPEH